MLAGATVIATTMHQLISHSALTHTLAEQGCDFVVIDEAAATPLPHIVFAATRAKSGCALLGDYLQNGPVVDKALAKDAYWTTDVFEHFGLTEPATADNTPGCVVLRVQYRFGDVITDYANAIAYGKQLRTGDPEKSSELVWIDVDGLPESLTQIDRGPEGVAGVWAAGSLLARALADYHAAKGKSVGVVVPYTAQRDATEAVLQESAHYARIEVGTAHAFQGLEYDVVIFDTVDDGHGWVGQASRTGRGWWLNGVRLCNVAVTRARKTVYVIADTKAANRKGPASPLGALRMMAQRHAVERVSAAQLLEYSVTSPPVVPVSPAHSAAIKAVKALVRVEGVYDEVSAVDQAVALINRAEHEVWSWSPWVGGGDQAIRIQDALAHAAARGVAAHAVVLHHGQVQPANQRSLARFRSRPELTVLVTDKMHQKLLVVDKRSVVIGSMNLHSTASRPADRRQEIMVEISSKSFAEQVLRAEWADHLKSPPNCPTGHGTIGYYTVRTQRNRRTYVWRCEECESERPFLDGDGNGPGRHQAGR